MGGGAKPARERGFTLDPFRSRIPVRCFVAPCLMLFDANFRPLIPYLSFAHALTKGLPAQVARAARSWATSQMARRVEHAAPCRGMVHSEKLNKKVGPFGAAALQGSGDRGREEGGAPQR